VILLIEISISQACSAEGLVKHKVHLHVFPLGAATGWNIKKGFRVQGSGFRAHFCVFVSGAHWWKYEEWLLKIEMPSVKAVDEKAAETCRLREKEFDRTVPFPRLKGGKRSGLRVRICPFAAPGSSEKSDCICCCCCCVCVTMRMPRCQRYKRGPRGIHKFGF
jgi:hypothetical protein